MHFTAVHCMRHYTSSRSAGGRRFSTHEYITFVALAGRLCLPEDQHSFV